MTVYPNGGSILVDSVILTKSQPSSYQIIDVKDTIVVPPPVAVEHDLRVYLLGSSYSRDVNVTNGIESFMNVADYGGMAYFSLKEGLWKVWATPVEGGSIDPDTLWIDLRQDSKLYFRSFDGNPSLHGDTLFSVAEGDTASWLLDEVLATNDANIGNWLASWSIKWCSGAKLPVSIDPATRRLHLGQLGSIVNGTGRYLLRATLPSGAFAQESLSVVVTPVNQYPVIHPIHWTVPVNGVVSVKLDSTYKGSGVWGHDPDDGVTTLVWGAEKTALSPPGMRLSMNGKTLTLAPSENSGDSLVLLLLLQDPSGAKDTQTVVVDVVPTRMVLFDASASQVTSTGDVVVTFRSRFTRESADLQKSLVKLRRGASTWGTIPASLEVLEPASYVNGTWIDGYYRVTIFRTARWQSGKIVGRFDSLFSGQTSLQIRIPLAADGRQDSLDVGLASLRFVGPVGRIQGSWSYASLDTLQRSPILKLDWNWDRSVHGQVVVVYDSANNIVRADSLTNDARHLDVAGLLDSAVAKVVVSAFDDLANKGEVRFASTSASGLYTVTLGFTGTNVREASGQVCEVSSSVCQTLSADASGSYQFRHLRQGAHRFVVQDPRWTGVGDTLAVSINHADVEQSWTLVSRHFLGAGSVLVSPTRTTGDWAFVVRPTAPFANELPSRVFVRWSAPKGFVQPSHGVDLTVSGVADSIGEDGARLWVFRLTRAEILAAADAPLTTEIHLDSIHIFTSDLQNGERSTFRSDAVRFPEDADEWFEQRLGVLPEMSVSRVVVDRAGMTSFRINRLTAKHGALQSMKLCLIGQDGAVEGVCFDTLLGRPKPIRFVAEGGNASPIGTLPFVVTKRASGALPVVVAPDGAGQAAAVWRFYAERDTVLTLWVDKLNAGFFTPYRFAVSMDSGATWSPKKAYADGWGDFGEVPVRAGWNSIAIRFENGLAIRAIQLQSAAQTSKPAVTTAADTIAYPMWISFARQLLVDRQYRLELEQSDDLGNASQVVKRTIFTRPQGALSDLSIIQIDSTGELHLQSNSTRITGAETFSVRLAPTVSMARVSVIARNDSLFELRIPKNRIPSAFLSDSSLVKASQLTGIVLRGSSTIHECHPVWHTWATGEQECEDRKETDSIVVPWPGALPWRNQLDYRAPAWYEIDSVGGRHDSVAIAVRGLNSQADSGTRLPGSLRVTWTPGSSCAPSTSVSLPYGNVFTPDVDGRFLFRPSLGAAILSKEGSWLGDVDDKQRHQWLDQPVGGGFFPPAGIQAFSDEGPWIDFVLRNPRPGTPQWDLWILPGRQNTESNKLFRWGVEKMATLAAKPGTMPMSASSALYEATTPGAWVKVAPVVTMTDTGLYRLRLQMIQDGFVARGIILQPAGSAAPTKSESELPTAGAWGYDSLLLQAGALASGTTHTFTFQATDRKGNTSAARTLTVTTPVSTVRVSSLRIQLDNSDSSGWVNGNALGAHLVANSDGIAPTSVHAELYIINATGSTKLASLTPVADGSGWSVSDALSAWPATTADLAAGFGYRLDVWADAQSTTGPHTVAFFGVRGAAHPGALTDLKKDVTLGGVTFRVLEAWPENGAIYANLELPVFTQKHGDTLESRIVLKSALVSFNNANPKVLQSVTGGSVAALRCEGTPVACSETDRATWTLGPWKGFLPVEDASLLPLNSGYRLSVKFAEFLDDKSRLVRTGPVQLNDAGLAQDAWVVADRVWFRNVVGAGKDDAFSFESCRLLIAPGSAGALDMSLRGCADNVGPFLSFGINLETESPFTLMGEAFDSLAKPYSISWKPGKGYVPQVDSVVVTQTTLHDFSGASVWGYDVHKYSFAPVGVNLLDFDVLLPDGKVFPAVSGEAWRIKNFQGLTVRSSSTVLDGKPIMSGSALSSDKRDLPFNSTQKLTGISSWTYRDVLGYGYVLDPSANTTGLAIVTPQPSGSFRYRAIGASNIDATDETFRVPVTKMVFGPGLFAEISSSNIFTAAAGGIKVSGTLSINPSEDSMEVIASDLDGTARGLSFPLGTNPWQSYASSKDWTKEGDPIALSDLSLSLDETFGITDISGTGEMPEQSALFIGRLPLLGFQSQSSFRLLPGKGDILVRLGSPSAWFSDLSYGQSSNPTSWIQSAVFNSSTLPVAVGAELPVPESMRTLRFPLFENLGSLYLNKVVLDASIANGAPSIALESQSTLELGSAFSFVGLDGWRFALNNLVLSANVTRTGSSFTPTMSVKSLEVAPLGIPASIELNAGQLKQWYGDKSETGSSGPALVRLYTAGQPIQGSWSGETSQFDVSMRGWAVELTKDFPVAVLRNLSFFLDTLDMSWKSSGVTFGNVVAHGSYSLDSLEVTSGLVLLPADAGKKVVLSLGAEDHKLFLRIDAGKVRMGQDVYDLGCGGGAYVKIRLDGKLEGDFCFTITNPVSLYPFGSTVGAGSKVWMHQGAQVHVAIDGSEITLSTGTVTVQTAPVDAMKAPNGLYFTGKLSASFDPKGILLKSAELTWDAQQSGLQPFSLDPFTLTLKSVTLSVANDRLKIAATPELGMNAGGKACSVSSGTMDVSFSANIKTGNDFTFSFNTGADLSCKVADFTATAKGIHLPAQPGTDFESIKVDTFLVDFGDAAKILSGADESSKWGSISMGLRLVEIGYFEKSPKSGKKFQLERVEPIGFKAKDLRLDVANTGLVVWADFDASGLFRPSKAGVLFDNIRVKLPEEIGGQTFNTNFAVRVDGVSPYIHARGSFKELPLPIPSIKLTETIKFDGANLKLRFVEGQNNAPDYWLLEGDAGLTIPGLASGIDVEMALKKPDKRDCRVGVCKAVLTLNMKPGRIPIGTTGLYMTKMMGGFYDGSYVPKCAQACDITTLPNGMKFELAIYIEGQSAESVHGATGFWMQLNKLNLGINGQLVMLSGAADATACAAIFNNGSAFHGAFNIQVHAAVDAQGGFYIDIWTERSRTNMAAEASASIGVKRGTFIKSRWFKFPRRTWWMGPLVTRFGKFQNGSQGFTTGVRALGRTWGIGYVGGLKLGNMGAYKLAKPSTGALTVANSDGYWLYPLGLDLKGGEAVSVAVTTAKGKDWGGKTLQFVPSSEFDAGMEGVIPHAVITLSDLGIDKAEVDEEDSSNTHTLTWLNSNQVGQMYVAIPKQVGSNVSAESEQNDNADILSGYDDLQLFVGLVPPTPQITAKKCTTGDTSEICFGGSVSGFRKNVVPIRRNLAVDDFVNVNNAVEEDGTLVYAGKHRLVLSAVPHWKQSGNVRSDSAAAIEIPLDEFEGQPDEGRSLADNACTNWNSSTNVLELNDCRWHNKEWRSGTYHFEAGIDEVNLRPAVEAANAQPLVESASSDVVSLGRVPVAASTESTVPNLLSWKHPPTFKKVHGLAVYGSALDSLTGPGGDETRTIRASWVPNHHPDLAGYVVRWPIGATGRKDFLAGPEGEWHVNLPRLNSLVDNAVYDSTVEVGKIARGNDANGHETPEWYFSVPDSLQIVPAIFDEKVETLFDSLAMRSYLDTMTIVVPLDSLAVTWKAKTVQIGQVDGATANAFTLAAPVQPTGTTTWNAPLLGSTTIPVHIAVASIDTGSTDVRPASDYLDATVSWVDANGVVLDDTGHVLPSVGIETPRMRIKSSLDSIPVVVTPIEKDLPCANLITHDTAKAATDSLLNRGACKDGQFLLRRSVIGDARLKLTVYNQARRSASQAQSLILPVRVVPPTPVIDNIKSNYVIAKRNQRLDLNISNYWKVGDSLPMLHIRTASGELIDSMHLDASSMGFALRDSLRKLQVDTLDSLHRARAQVRLKWRTKGINPTGDSVYLTVTNRAVQGRFVSAKAAVLLLDNAMALRMECADALLPENGYPNNAWAMDFVGFYPKVRAPGSRVRAVFSEIHSPDELEWKAWVIQKGDSIPVRDLSPWDGGVDFTIPATLTPGEITTIGVGIAKGDPNIYESCHKDWTSKSKLAAPASSRIKFLVKDSLVQVLGLQSDESYVWWRGEAVGLFEPRKFRGDASGFIVPQSDWIHVRVTNTSEMLVRDTAFLVQRSVRLSAKADEVALNAIDSARMGSRVVVVSNPVPTQGPLGESSMSVECRWNAGGWSACPSEGFVVDSSHHGLLVARPVWTIRASTGVETVTGAQTSWRIGLRSAASEGIQVVRLEAPSARLKTVVDSMIVAPIMLVRRSGNELPAWGNRAPVVRDVDGRILPQEVERWNPATREYLAWVRVPVVNPSNGLVLQLWLGDTTSVQSPWDKSDVVVHEGTGGNLIGQAVSYGPRKAIDLPALNSDGFTASLWFKWSPSTDTLWCRNGLCIGADSHGAVWMSWEGERLESRRGVLDTTEPYLLSAAWKAISGKTCLSVNGTCVIEGFLRAGLDGRLAASGSWAGKGDVDEVRWEARPLTQRLHRLRWELERLHSDFWTLPSVSVGTRPVVRRIGAALTDTIAVANGERLFFDRERTFGSVPGEWQGGLLLKGSGSDANEAANGERVVLPLASRLCVVTDSGWRPADKSRWQDLTAMVDAGDAVLAAWCQEVGAGVRSLPYALDAGSGNRLGASWLVLPSRAKTDTRATGGASVGGVTLPDPLDPLLDGSTILAGSGDTSGAIPLDGPGIIFVAVKHGSALGDSLSAAGWSGPLTQVLVTRNVDGSIDTLDVYLRAGGADRGTLRWGNTEWPVIVFVRPASSTNSASDSLDDGDSSNVKILPVVTTDSGSCVQSAAGTLLCFDRTVGPVNPVGSCSSRIVITSASAATGTRWLALPQDSKWETLEGWKFVRAIKVSNAPWVLMARRKGVVGAEVVDLASLWTETMVCAEYVTWFEADVTVPPRWALQQVAVRGIGGTRQAWGGEHALRDLDLEPIASTSLTGPQYQMRLSSVAGFGASLQKSVLSLGTPRTTVVDAEDGATIVHVAHEASLLDLRAEYLDADSVKIDVVSLEAKGLVRMTLRDHGDVPFTGTLKAILYRDRNGDLQYNAGADELLGVQILAVDGCNRTISVDFSVQGNRLYPEETFLALIDGGASLPEQRYGDHSVASADVCRRHKSFAWYATPTSAVRPVVADELIVGAVPTAVHLRSTDGRAGITAADSTDWMWVRAGQGSLCVAKAGMDTSWCRDIGIAGLGDVSIRDRNGDGVPEIVAGNSILSVDGAVLWTTGTASPVITKYDLDDDGLLDTLRGAPACPSAVSGSGELLWGDLTCGPGARAASLSQIEPDPELCVDASLSYPRVLVGRTGFKLRLANAGTRLLPAGIKIVLRNPSGNTVLEQSTVRSIAAGEWEDVVLETGSAVRSGSWKVQIVESELGYGLSGMLDIDLHNDSIDWVEE